MLNVQTSAYEQLQLLEPDIEPGVLRPLGIPGFAGYFLSLIEDPSHRGGPWTIAIARAFGGDTGDVLIVARRGNVEIRRQDQPVEAAIQVFREATARERAIAA